MKRHFSADCVFVIVVLIAMFLSSCGKVSYKSANWQVKVLSAKFEDKFSLGTSTEDGFVIKLLITYIGKPGKVVLPEVYLLTSESKLYAKAVDSRKFTDRLISLLSMDRKEYDLKNGEIICDDTASILFDVKKSNEKYSLHVGDISPINLSAAGY